MNKEQLIRNWLMSQKRQEDFKGWDFSSIYADFWQEELEWNYQEIVQKYLTKEMALLDMGTGGGELLATFNHPFHLTSVTEGWLTNYHLLQEKLEPQGIVVKFVEENDHLDFPDNSFDIVINSHESFDLREIKRVLKPRGLFITQQVGDLNGVNLASRLIPNYHKNEFNLHLSLVVKELKTLNFDIVEEFEAYPSQKFLSMDALIYYVRTISWEYSNFEVETHLEELFYLYDELQRKGHIYNQQHRFLIVARN